MQIKTKIVSSHTADSKQVKLEVNGTMILPPLVFPGLTLKLVLMKRKSLITQKPENHLAYLTGSDDDLISGSKPEARSMFSGL